MNHRPGTSNIVALAVLLSAGVAFAGWQEWPSEVALQTEFEVAAGGTLKVDLPDADIELITEARDGVGIEILVAGKDLDRARAQFEKMNFRAELQGDTVILKADHVRTNFNWRSGGGFLVLARITLPERFDLEIETGDGDISVESILGAVSLASSDGDIFAESIDGPEISVVSSDGDIAIETLRGTSAVIKTSDGDVSLGQVDGNQFDVRSSDGDIEIESISGELKAMTSDGDIEVNIGRLGNTTLSSGDGDIYVTLEEGQAAEIDLRGEEVVVRGLSGFSGVQKDQSARGEIHGGGPELKASTNDGEVVLSVR